MPRPGQHQVKLWQPQVVGDDSLSCKMIVGTMELMTYIHTHINRYTCKYTHLAYNHDNGGVL